ncbi:hypothetical protein pb186bvf_010204 [Paramecium bursaria]
MNNIRVHVQLRPTLQKLYQRELRCQQEQLAYALCASDFQQQHQCQKEFQVLKQCLKK